MMTKIGLRMLFYNKLYKRNIRLYSKHWGRYDKHSIEYGANNGVWVYIGDTYIPSVPVLLGIRLRKAYHRLLSKYYELRFKRYKRRSWERATEAMKAWDWIEKMKEIKRTNHIYYLFERDRSQLTHSEIIECTQFAKELRDYHLL